MNTHTQSTHWLVQLNNVVQFCSVFSQHSDYSDVGKETLVLRETQTFLKKVEFLQSTEISK